MRKRCRNCKKMKSEFGKRSRTKDGFCVNCKDCTRKWVKAHYKKHKQYYINNARKTEAEVDKLVRDIKEKNPCKDCSKKYPYYVMDFDHRDGEKKEFCIGHKRSSRNLILAEIAKCDVVCSNCHRERTHQRRVRGVNG